ncbi:MAG: bifunctional 2-polyprenyl-6-hydroxyphenol methylase/3-demethylubiquinol 3-O-methyltransferase UbiG [Gammaproteobacteria bacterium]|nr:bifunctional 2-polyprenyl-6-hydroxyphenol methylase/3-demethylubiquinol 3-O-methyltransferase UbiG [Gammaproteobacteria bacterium]
MSDAATNRDPAELEKFTALAQSWWDPNGPLKTLHEINPLRLGYVAERTPLQGRRVLDVGCGGGLLSEALAKSGADVVGIDLAGAGLAAARAHAEVEGLAIDYFEEDAETHAARASGAYDVVTCMELLEHVPDPAAIVTACAQAVKPGGAVFFSTISRNLKSFVLAIVAAEHVLRLVPRGTHEYARLIRPSELAGWCRASGLNVSDISGMHYNPLTGHHRLGGRPDVNYLCHTIRPMRP